MACPFCGGCMQWHGDDQYICCSCGYTMYY